MVVLAGVAGLAAGAVVDRSAWAGLDVLEQWNEAWLDTIRVIGGPPCPIARNGAILYVAMYEAVNSIEPTYEPYIGFLPVQEPALTDAAAAAAAHRALVTLYPARTPVYDALYQLQLSSMPDGPAKSNGIQVGVAAADQVMDARAQDGTASEPPYIYLDIPGSYRPTPPDFTSPPFNPGWGSTQPWSMITGSQFRPPGPNGYSQLSKLLPTVGYARQLNEVKDYGARVSASRTPDMTEIAWFWANDRDGTYKPPGHLMHITQVVARDFAPVSFNERARLFALAAIAMADAGLAAWDMKYATDTDLWRPVSAIREAHTDNNPLTVADPDWLPLLEFSPPFPAYTSGHATFGAVHAAIMRNFYGTDDIVFTVGTDEPIVSSVTRTFQNFTQAGRENGLSRIYLGVHFRFDADTAYYAGTALGDYVYAHHLRPLACVAVDLNGDSQIGFPDLLVLLGSWGSCEGCPADLNSDGHVDFEDVLHLLSMWEGCF
ncbi:MAG: vanadium-dependent haloperoxidase [Phycisphaeraceae bacterium]|nr:vanadium-dependent haloperoxidase [Phycisphaeraceae bacterium]